MTGETVDCIGLLAEKTRWRWRRSGTVFCDARLSRPGPRKNGMKCIGRKLAPPQPPTLICVCICSIYVYICINHNVLFRRVVGCIYNNIAELSPPKDPTELSGGPYIPREKKNKNKKKRIREVHAYRSSSSSSSASSPLLILYYRVRCVEVFFF